MVDPSKRRDVFALRPQFFAIFSFITLQWRRLDGVGLTDTVTPIILKERIGGGSSHKFALKNSAFRCTLYHAIVQASKSLKNGKCHFTDLTLKFSAFEWEIFIPKCFLHFSCPSRTSV